MAGRNTDRPRGTAEPPEDDDHLADIPDGCGCAEVWEHLSEGRE